MLHLVTFLGNRHASQGDLKSQLLLLGVGYQDDDDDEFGRVNDQLEHLGCMVGAWFTAVRREHGHTLAA